MAVANPAGLCGETPAMKDLDAWFVTDVLPLEPFLMRFLQRHWRNPADIADLRQEVYVRVYTAAATQRPAQMKPFLMAVARNLIIDWTRRAQVVPIRAISAADEARLQCELAAPDRDVDGKQQLARLLSVLDALPARCREVVRLRRVEGCSQQETARRMGIAEHTVERQMANAMRRLTNAFLEPVETMPRPLPLAVRRRRHGER